MAHSRWLAHQVLPRGIAFEWTDLAFQQEQRVVGNLRSFARPTLTLALVEWPGFMRILRSDAIAVLQQDYVLMAKAKGLRDGHILFRHVLKPSSFTLITVAGLTIAGLIAGVFVVENIFALPGVGRLLVGAITNRDFMMVQGAVTVIAVRIRAREFCRRHALFVSRSASFAMTLQRVGTSVDAISADRESFVPANVARKRLRLGWGFGSASFGLRVSRLRR